MCPQVDAFCANINIIHVTCNERNKFVCWLADAVDPLGTGGVELGCTEPKNPRSVAISHSSQIWQLVHAPFSMTRQKSCRLYYKMG